MPESSPPLGEPTVADAICDRLFSNSETIELKGDSLRRFPPKLDLNLPPSYATQLRTLRNCVRFAASHAKLTHESGGRFRRNT
jgi:hypothetical protein